MASQRHSGQRQRPAEDNATCCRGPNQDQAIIPPTSYRDVAENDSTSRSCAQVENSRVTDAQPDRRQDAMRTRPASPEHTIDGHSTPHPSPFQHAVAHNTDLPPPPTTTTDGPVEMIDGLPLVPGLRREGTTVSMENTHQISNGVWWTEVIGDCPSCKYSYRGEKVPIQVGDRYTGVNCSQCGRRWFGLVPCDPRESMDANNSRTMSSRHENYSRTRSRASTVSRSSPSARFVQASRGTTPSPMPTSLEPASHGLSRHPSTARSSATNDRIHIAPYLAQEIMGNASILSHVDRPDLGNTETKRRLKFQKFLKLFSTKRINVKHIWRRIFKKDHRDTTKASLPATTTAPPLQNDGTTLVPLEQHSSHPVSSIAEQSTHVDVPLIVTTLTRDQSPPNVVHDENHLDPQANPARHDFAPPASTSPVTQSPSRSWTSSPSEPPNAPSNSYPNESSGSRQSGNSSQHSDPNPSPHRQCHHADCQCTPVCQCIEEYHARIDRERQEEVLHTGSMFEENGQGGPSVGGDNYIYGTSLSVSTSSPPGRNGSGDSGRPDTTGTETLPE